MSTKKAVTEKTLERNLVCKVKELGGIALKYSSMYVTAYPDRIVMFPGGLLFWVELKSPGKVPTELQNIRHEELRALGQKVYVVDSEESLNRLCSCMQFLSTRYVSMYVNKPIE